MSSESELIPYHARQTLGTGPVLVLAAHPDDEVFGCGGAIMRHVAAGDPVTVIILTDGGGFHADGPEREAYIAQRRQESSAAATILGYGQPLFWEYRDRELNDSEALRQRLYAVVMATHAHWLYAPSPSEIHPDHRQLGLATLAVVHRLSGTLMLAFYEIGAPLPPNRLLDISDLSERKHQAMACFPSQLSVQAYDRHIVALNQYRTYTLSGTVTAAEAYWVIAGDEIKDSGRLMAAVERQLGLAEMRAVIQAEIGLGRMSLTIAIVTYAPDLKVLAEVLKKLGQAVHHARQYRVSIQFPPLAKGGEGGFESHCPHEIPPDPPFSKGGGEQLQHRRLTEARLIVVDNGPDLNERESIRQIIESAKLPMTVQILSGHGNVGYGAGHNLALWQSQADWHLILNPDVLMEEDTLSAGLEFLTTHPEAGLIAPAVWNQAGQRQYLCKRYPTVLDLALRGFAPVKLRRHFKTRLDRYELHDLDPAVVQWDPPIASGCFMLCQRAVLQQIGGFQPDYFLYFEDFDLSLRLAKVTRLVYVPTVRIVHLGGHAARKGLRHIAWFIRAAALFFHRHGWRWW